MQQDGALPSLSAVELRRRIGTKEISPVELLEACIERIGTIDPAINAIAATGYARAREEARAAEAAVLRGDDLGRLHGLPTGIKDLSDTEGLLTTHGSPLYRDHVPKSDAAMVALVRKAGAIIVAKTNTPEFGAGANTRNPVWGATGNPFDPALNAGGSSGGSAAALACDLLPVCTGSDMGGSLRIPAAKCGVVGMRPSPGLVPDDARPLGWTPISVLGPMGRTVADVRLLLAAQVGLDDREPLGFALGSDDVGFARPADLGRLRVAWTEDFGKCPVSSEIRTVMRARIGAMRHLFRSCDEVQFDFGEADRCFDVVRAQSFIARHQATYARDPALLGPNVRANYELGAKMTLPDVSWAHAEQTRIFRRFQTYFRDCDLVLAPTTPVTPFPWSRLYLAELEGKPLKNYYHWLALTYYISLVTNPAV
jgi:Asp-tRNA(Asn)/Glu-tRNA(Gln) amidotransferase A subunit family amidase